MRQDCRQLHFAAVLSVLVLLHLVLHPVHSVFCHSCFQGCALHSEGLDKSDCDCSSSSDAHHCQGPYCFAKMEFFAQESAASIQKGCSNEIPGSSEGCYSAGEPDSRVCFCQGELCNSKKALKNFERKQLPEVTCCHCGQPEGQPCSRDTCTETCRGAYCYYDFVSRDQACGYGHPQLQNFLRTQHYTKHRNETTCARYEAGLSTLVHGCTCASDKCNVARTLQEFDKKRVSEESLQPSQSSKLNCFSIHKYRRKPFEESIYKQATKCKGHFCFVSYTTASVSIESSHAEDDEYYDDEGEASGDVQDERPMPVLYKTYEITAGCLDADNSEKVHVGCSVEWQTSPQEPLVKHCICREHMCNYFHHISEETIKNRLSGVRPRPTADTKSTKSPTRTTSAIGDESPSPSLTATKLLTSGVQDSTATLREETEAERVTEQKLEVGLEPDSEPRAEGFAPVPERPAEESLVKTAPLLKSNSRFVVIHVVFVIVLLRFSLTP